MTGRWLLAACLILLVCVLALVVDGNRSLSAPPHLPQLVEPAGPARLEDMALERDRPPLPTSNWILMTLPFFTVTPDPDQEAPSCLDREGWNA